MKAIYVLVTNKHYQQIKKFCRKNKVTMKQLFQENIDKITQPTNEVN